VKKTAATRTQTLLSVASDLKVFQPDTARRTAEAKSTPIKNALVPMFPASRNVTVAVVKLRLLLLLSSPFKRRRGTIVILLHFFYFVNDFLRFGFFIETSLSVSPSLIIETVSPCLNSPERIPFANGSSIIF